MAILLDLILPRVPITANEIRRKGFLKKYIHERTAWRNLLIAYRQNLKQLGPPHWWIQDQDRYSDGSPREVFVTILCCYKRPRDFDQPLVKPLIDSLHGRPSGSIKAGTRWQGVGILVDDRKKFVRGPLVLNTTHNWHCEGTWVRIRDADDYRNIDLDMEVGFKEETNISGGGLFPAWVQ